MFVVLGPSPTHLATMQVALARMETGIPVGNVMIFYMKGLLLQNGAPGLNVATCGVANATRFSLLATNFSRMVASLATQISSYYFISVIFSLPEIHDEINDCCHRFR